MNTQVNVSDPRSRVDHLVTEKQAAPMVGCSAASLKQSRHTGILFGRPAPPFVKMGRSARYKISTLLRFVSQFPEYQNTSQINEKTR